MNPAAEGSRRGEEPEPGPLADDDAEHTIISPRRTPSVSENAVTEDVADSGAAESAERTVISARRRTAMGPGNAPEGARDESAADDLRDTTIVNDRDATRIDDNTVRAARVPRPTPRTASAPDRAALPSSRTASAPGRIAHAPAVGAERYPRREMPQVPDQPDREPPPDAGIPSPADAHAVERAVRSTARRRAVLLGAAILLALGSAAVVLVVLLGGIAA